MRDNIGILGGGLMGQGIALVFARRRYDVIVYEPFEEARLSFAARLEASFSALTGGLDGFSDVAARVRVTDELETAVREAGLVIEAAPEKVELKRTLLAGAATLCPKRCILASNTSVIPITRLAEGLDIDDRPRLVGTHWWNPPYLVPLVEVIQTEWSDPGHVEAVIALLGAIGKTAVHVRRDVAGFVGNRLQHALWREAVSLVEAGICDAETVDTVVKASFGRRLAVLGPLENADLVGTDLTLDIHRTVLPGIDSRPHESPYLADLVASGRLGMKSGEGFRRWTPQESMAVRQRLGAYLARLDNLLDETSAAQAAHPGYRP